MISLGCCSCFAPTGAWVVTGASTSFMDSAPRRHGQKKHRKNSEFLRVARSEGLGPVRPRIGLRCTVGCADRNRRAVGPPCRLVEAGLGLVPLRCLDYPVAGTGATDSLKTA